MRWRTIHGPTALSPTRTGPDTFSFDELPRLLASAVGSRIQFAHTPAHVGYALTQVVGLLLRDVPLTRDEVDSLTPGLLNSDVKPTGTTKLGD